MFIKERRGYKKYLCIFTFEKKKSMKNKPETNGIDHLKRIGENGVEPLGTGKTALEIRKNDASEFACFVCTYTTHQQTRTDF